MLIALHTSFSGIKPIPDIGSDINPISKGKDRMSSMLDIITVSKPIIILRLVVISGRNNSANKDQPGVLESRKGTERIDSLNS